MSYVYRPFPKMIHRPGGAQKIVQDATELSDALLQGWSLRPVLAASDPSGWPYPEPAAVPVEPNEDDGPVERPVLHIGEPDDEPVDAPAPVRRGKARKARE